MPKRSPPKTRAVKSIPYNFGAKHLRYIKRCEDSLINVAEGAVRAGKTVDHILAFCIALETTRDKIHLATASTAPTAKAVLGDCNGFGIEHYFRGQCRWGKFKGNEALIICGKSTGYRERIVLFVGGAKINSYYKFRGFSIGMWIATEINLHHDNTIKEAFNRQLAAKDRKVFWDLNPSPPEHPIYTEYIDKYAKMQSEGKLAFKYNYERFTIFDNINIPEENRRAIISQYVEGSLWYLRDIKGERTTPDGLVFPEFANNRDDYITENYPTSMRMINIGVDFGGNGSKTVFVATGIIGNFNSLAALADHKVEGAKGTIDINVICRDLVEFIRFIRAMFPTVPIAGIHCDCAETTIITSIMFYLLKNGIKVPVLESRKGLINGRIFALSSLIAQHRFTVYRDCKNVIISLCSQVWDSKERKKFVRLDDGTKDIDTADALEYSFAPYIEAFGFSMKGGN
ncbi:MAG: PBSX family phage terminase large subunit, partial [Oscillospiraceae bacterium]|nr:PBSX family phage terminase large subunit [Oscillospiraceae bacterium]